MTVKIASLLTPPPPSIATTTLAPNIDTNNDYYLHYTPYEDHYKKKTFDTFTMPYTTASSIMTDRDHPFNHSTQSTRPLLAEQKPPQLLGKKKFNNSTICNGTTVPVTRDSGAKVQGINDFDIISQQYKNLNSHHLGYPYGSPPSPTAISSDFVFSDTTPVPATMTVSPNQFLFDNNPSISRTNESNYYCNTSRFEDDFCCRRNDRFQNADSSRFHTGNGTRLSPEGGTGPAPMNGPFIFGLHNRSPPGGKDFNDSTAVISDREATRYPMENGQKSMSNSDTSSGSRDSGKGSKLLLKSRKSSKKNSKEKKSPTSNRTKEDLPHIKCVVVGDADIGKTNLIVTYLENRFISEHVPTASDIYKAEVMVNDSPVHVTLCDTSGQDTLDPLRELCYPDSDVFLLCFSVVKPETFHSIKSKWAPKFTKNPASLILVGTQSDLRSNIHVLNKLQTKGEKPISFADAWDLATSIKAKYIETSSFTQDKVKDVFDTAIWDALAPTTLPPTPPFWKKLFCLV